MKPSPRNRKPAEHFKLATTQAAKKKTASAPSATHGCASTTLCTGDAYLRRGAPSSTIVSVLADVNIQPAPSTGRLSRTC